MIIGPNDPINDDHQDRGLGLVDAMETIRQENDRTSSPLLPSCIGYTCNAISVIKETPLYIFLLIGSLLYLQYFFQI